jgi:hypothetical protein
LKAHEESFFASKILESVIENIQGIDAGSDCDGNKTKVIVKGYASIEVNESKSH